MNTGSTHLGLSRAIECLGELRYVADRAMNSIKRRRMGIRSDSNNSRTGNRARRPYTRKRNKEKLFRSESLETREAIVCCGV